jgi:hypothetical protein
VKNLSNCMMASHTILVEMSRTDELAREYATDAMCVMHCVHVDNKVLVFDVLNDLHLAS